MNEERLKKYTELSSRIGKTRLDRYPFTTPNNNTIWIKRECDNPYGSHYDRVYLAIFRHLEAGNQLQPGMNVLETSSGSAGISFAGIGRELGYNCYVMIPEDEIKRKRIEEIRNQGGVVIPTSSEEDIQGFTRERIVANMRKYRAKFLNHSMGPQNTNNEITLSALEEIAEEVLKQTSVEVFVAGIGNGSSIVGPGRVLKRHNSNLQVIGYMPNQSGKSQYPGLMNQDGLLNKINFPHITEAGLMLDRTVLVENWNEGVTDNEDLGRSAKAGISVALKIAKEVRRKNILVIGYDSATRYDTTEYKKDKIQGLRFVDDRHIRFTCQPPIEQDKCPNEYFLASSVEQATLKRDEVSVIKRFLGRNWAERFVLTEEEAQDPGYRPNPNRERFMANIQFPGRPCPRLEERFDTACKLIQHFMR